MNILKRKTYQSERPFSITLAEEILRAELRKLYGNEIKFFECSITGTKPEQKSKTMSFKMKSGNCGTTEYKWGRHENHIERYVNIKAKFGPFERLFPHNPKTDQRREVRTVKAECRLYSVESGCTFWKPHFIHFDIYDYAGEQVDCKEMFYENGLHKDREHTQTAENPCHDMCFSQVSVMCPDWISFAKIIEEEKVS